MLSKLCLGPAISSWYKQTASVKQLIFIRQYKTTLNINIISPYVLCFCAFPKIYCMYPSKFALVRYMYFLGSSGIPLNIQRLLMTRYLFSAYKCLGFFFLLLLFGASSVSHEHQQLKKSYLHVQTLTTTSHHHNFRNAFCV